MRHGLFLPPYGPLSDIPLVVDLALEAEAAGFDGVFLWDHVLRPPHDPIEIADTWVALAALAQATERVQLGPLVTPITRRRPQKLARETVSVDRLSGGRLVMGFGLGVDSGRELSGFGEVVDPVERGRRLDEGIEVLQALWSGEPVEHRGEAFVADGVTFLPTPVRGSIPMWFAARGDAKKPVRRAARHDGLFPVEVDRDQLARMTELVAAERGSLDGFDVACNDSVGGEELAEIGVTWLLHGPAPGADAAEVREIITRVAG